jgi:signal transduction histidine kinase
MDIVNKKLVKNVILMLFFGLLSFFMGKVQFVIPGVQGSIRDLRELSILISILYLPHWIYYIGISFISVIGSLPDKSFITGFLMHLVPSVFVWYGYHFFLKKTANPYYLGGVWLFMVIIYYWVFCLPIWSVSNALLGKIEKSDILSFYHSVFIATRFELFVTMAISSLYLISFQMTRILKDKNMDLRVALKKAEESDRLKSSFLMNVSHEIRTPMNGIMGFSNLLVDPKLSEDKRAEYSDIILTCSSQLLSIIDNILDLSKIEAGLTDVHYSRFSADSLMDRIELLYAPMVAVKEIRLSVIKPQETATIWIHSDEVKVRQILYNLINNAIKFTSKGYIRVGYSRVGTKLQFFVADSGIGIDPLFHEKIFQPFQQVQASTTREYGGSGLGLAIVKAMVELLGGEVKLDSTPGKGSIFYFTLPYDQADKDAMQNNE